MRMLIVYDSTSCAHQGFPGEFEALNGDQNWLTSVISFDSHSLLNVPHNLGLSSGLCSDHKHLLSVYVGNDVQMSFASTLLLPVVL